MSAYQLRILGSFSLTLDGVTHTLTGHPRPQALLAYLALQDSRQVSRAQAAAALWPESSDTQARANLRRVIAALRSAVPGILQELLIDPHHLAWRDPAALACDAIEFREAARRATIAPDLRAWDRAVALYGGELLPGCDDEWAQDARNQLRDTYLRALTNLARLLEEHGDVARALNVTEQLITGDPLDEEAWTRLLRLHVANDDPEGADRVMLRCEQTFRREVGGPPGRVVLDTYRQLRLGVSRGPTSPFVGRAREWAVLNDVWRDGRAGRPRACLLLGEPGIGKSRLAHEWVVRQQTASPHLHLSCHHSERLLAYAPLVDVLGQLQVTRQLDHLDARWLQDLRALLPTARWSPGSSAVEGLHKTRLLGALDAALLGSHPRLLLIDDLHWCDAETFEWVCHALHHGPPGLMVIATARLPDLGEDHPFHRTLLELERDGQVRRLELGPLEAREAARLAREYAPEQTSEERVQAALLHSEGNPLFLLEGLRGDPDAQGNVRALIEARLAPLPAEARRTLDALAVLGVPSGPALVAAVSGLPEESTVTALELLERQRLLRAHGHRLQLSHDRVREVAYATQGAARRAWLHRRAAAALVRHEGSAAARAWHLERAGESSAALQAYLEAAEEASRVFANTTAAQHYREASRLLEDTDEPHSARRLFEGHGDLLARTTDARGAVRAYTRALEHALPDDRARLLRKLGAAHTVIGEGEQAERQFTLAEAYTQPGDAEWVRVTLERIDLLYWRDRPADMQQLLERVRPHVKALNEPRLLRRYHLQEVSAQLRASRYTPNEVALWHAHVAQEYARATHDPSLSVHFNIGFCHLHRGELPQAAHHLEAGYALAVQTGNTLLALRCAVYRAVAARREGDAQVMEQWDHLAVTHLHVPGGATYAGNVEANRAWSALRANQLRAARHAALRALDAWGQMHASEYPLQWLALLPMLHLDVMGAGRTGASDEPDLEGAARWTTALLDESQQLLPEPLSGLLRSALELWTAGRVADSRGKWLAALLVARDDGWL